MMPAPITNMIGDEIGNPICNTVSFLKNMMNDYHDEKAWKVSPRLPA